MKWWKCWFRGIRNKVSKGLPNETFAILPKCHHRWWMPSQWSSWIRLKLRKEQGWRYLPEFLSVLWVYCWQFVGLLYPGFQMLLPSPKSMVCPPGRGKWCWCGLLAHNPEPFPWPEPPKRLYWHCRRHGWEMIWRLRLSYWPELSLFLFWAFPGSHSGRDKRRNWDWLLLFRSIPQTIDQSLNPNPIFQH